MVAGGYTNNPKIYTSYDPITDCDYSNISNGNKFESLDYKLSLSGNSGELSSQDSTYSIEGDFITLTGDATRRLNLNTRYCKDKYPKLYIKIMFDDTTSNGSSLDSAPSPAPTDSNNKSFTYMGTMFENVVFEGIFDYSAIITDTDSGKITIWNPSPVESDKSIGKILYDKIIAGGNSFTTTPTELTYNLINTTFGTTLSGSSELRYPRMYVLASFINTFATGDLLLLDDAGIHKLGPDTSKLYATKERVDNIESSSIGKSGTGIGAEIFNVYEYNKATGSYSHAEGQSNSSIGTASHTEGAFNISSGLYSHAEGNSNKSIGDTSHVEGHACSARATASHSEGNHSQTGRAAFKVKSVIPRAKIIILTKTTGLSVNDTLTLYVPPASMSDQYSIYSKFGKITAINGTRITVDSMNSNIKANTYIYIDDNYDLGDGSYILGDYSHSEGTETYAIGIASHAEGNCTETLGDYSHAEGHNTLALGTWSHVEGHGTRADGENQHTEGKYNIIDREDKYAHITGNGTSKTDTSNAYTLDWSGNGWFQGNVKVGGSSYDDAAAKELATKEDVENSSEPYICIKKEILENLELNSTEPRQIGTISSNVDCSKYDTWVATIGNQFQGSYDDTVGGNTLFAISTNNAILKTDSFCQLGNFYQHGNTQIMINITSDNKIYGYYWGAISSKPNMPSDIYIKPIKQIYTSIANDMTLFIPDFSKIELLTPTTKTKENCLFQSIYTIDENIPFCSKQQYAMPYGITFKQFGLRSSGNFILRLKVYGTEDAPTDDYTFCVRKAGQSANFTQYGDCPKIGETKIYEIPLSTTEISYGNYAFAIGWQKKNLTNISQVDITVTGIQLLEISIYADLNLNGSAAPNGGEMVVDKKIATYNNTQTFTNKLAWDKSNYSEIV